MYFLKKMKTLPWVGIKPKTTGKPIRCCSHYTMEPHTLVHFSSSIYILFIRSQETAVVKEWGLAEINLQ